MKAFLSGGFAMVLYCCLSTTAMGAVTFDNAVSATGSGGVTFPMTVSGSNRLLVVEVGVSANDGAASITSAFYGGVSMTQVLQTLRAGGGGSTQGIFVLSAPATGTNNVVVNLAGAKPVAVGAIDYNGVDQTTPIGAVTFTQNASSVSQAVTLTTTATGSYRLANFRGYSNKKTISSFGLGQTQRWSQVQGNSMEGDDLLTLAAGVTTMSYTLSTAKTGDIQAVEIIPSGLVPTNTPTNSATNTATNTPTNTATNTPTNTATNTATQTATNTPTNTATNTGTNTATQTSTSTATNTTTNTSTDTSTNTPTSSATDTSTHTPTQTSSDTPTNTATQTATQTATNTLANTATNTATRTATDTSTSTPTATKTPTPTNTKTFTNTPTITDTPVPTNTPTATPLPTLGVWPNPFTPMLTTNNWTHFTVPAVHGAGEYIIMTLRQRPVRTLKFDPNVAVGWDGKDDSGRVVPGGLYLYLLKVDGRARRGTIAVLK
jgi:hypothetical protein